MKSYIRSDNGSCILFDLNESNKYEHPTPTSNCGCIDIVLWFIFNVVLNVLTSLLNLTAVSLFNVCLYSHTLPNRYSHSNDPLIQPTQLY